MHVRFPKTLGNKRTSWPPNWIKFVYECNEIAPGFFGRPVMDIGTVNICREIYPDAEVIHRTDPKDMSVSIISTTPYGVEIMKQAAERLGINYV